MPTQTPSPQQTRSKALCFAFLADVLACLLDELPPDSLARPDVERIEANSYQGFRRELGLYAAYRHRAANSEDVT